MAVNCQSKTCRSRCTSHSFEYWFNNDWIIIYMVILNCKADYCNSKSLKRYNICQIWKQWWIQKVRTMVGGMGLPTYILDKFFKKLHENKKGLGQDRRRACPCVRPLNLPMEINVLFAHVLLLQELNSFNFDMCHKHY